MRLVFLIALPFLLAACAPAPAPTVPVRADSVAVEAEEPLVEVPLPGGGTPDPEGLARLDDARAKWEAQAPEVYRLTYTRHCFCPPQYRGPFTVTVRSGEPAGVTYGGEGEPVEAALDGAALAVDDLFDVVLDAYKRNAAEVHVAYDAQTGQPTSIQIDYDYQMADEEVGFTIEPAQPIGG